jgi:hypothetical protein
MVTVTRQAEHRLADIEVEQYIVVDGVKLIRAASGRYYAESRSAPGTLWFLTGFSCQCPGFLHRQTCRHHRALMQALGWTRPEPTPPAVTCAECHGAGTVPATIATGPRSWAYTNETCPSCHGTGSVHLAA